MKTINKLLYFFIVIFLISCQSSGDFYKDAICIQNINIIDPSNGLIENQTVIVQNEKIIKVVDSKTLILSEENKIIDGTGKYLMPGLWDAHIHFAFMEDLAPSMFDLFLLHGITSVRDTGGKVDFVKNWKDKALANPTAAPRVMMAGPLLDGEPNVYDGSDVAHPELSVGLDDVDAVSNAVNHLLDKNVDLLKAYEMLTPEQFVKINELAEANNLKLTGHIPLSMDAISASNAGMNSIEHMRNLEISCASNAEELWQQRKAMLLNKSNLSGGDLRSSIHTAQREIAVDNYDESRANQVLKVLKENDTWQIPTQALNTIHTRKYFARPDWQKSYELLPKEITKLWIEQSNILNEQEIPKGKEKWNQWNFMMVKKIHDTEIPIMAGTDTPIAFLTPGLSLHEELRVLVEDVGISTSEALKMATINPAKYFNMEGELGSVKENMWADLLILHANPLEDINNTQKIDAVIRQGKLYDQMVLDEIRKKLQNQ